MRKIILEKFREWSAQSGTPAVNIFKGVRDIPFAVNTAFYGPEEGPAAILKDNRGFCVPKHYLLGMMFEKMGMDVKYFIYTFRWHDLHLPHGLKERSASLPETFHLACKAHIEKKWLLVDATWDTPLSKAGFPVNLEWDGRTDTLNAVKPISEHVCPTAVESEAFLKKKMSVYHLPEKLALARFSADLNQWLEEVRSR